MHAFDVLGDPVRRRILELLADGERPAGEISARIGEEFGISQAGVSQHLKVLREAGFAWVRPEGTRRIYAFSPEPLEALDAWLDHFRGFWTHRFEALATEVARGKRRRAREEGES
jgi:DNA-binding transcriptional ArsR family regulator